MIGCGRLQLGVVGAFDGVVWFKVWSPALKKRIRRGLGSDAGWYWVIGEWVLIFRRNKKMVAHYFSIGERYGREFINERTQ